MEFLHDTSDINISSPTKYMPKTIIRSSRYAYGKFIPSDLQIFPDKSTLIQIKIRDLPNVKKNSLSLFDGLGEIICSKIELSSWRALLRNFVTEMSIEHFVTEGEGAALDYFIESTRGY